MYPYVRYPKTELAVHLSLLAHLFLILFKFLLGKKYCCQLLLHCNDAESTEIPNPPSSFIGILKWSALSIYTSKVFLDSPRIQKLNVIFLFPTSRHQYKYQIVYIWDRPFNSLRASVLYDSLLAERLALGALVILFCNLHYWHVIDEAVEANLFLYFLSLEGWLKRFCFFLFWAWL